MEIRECVQADVETLERGWPSRCVWMGHLRRQIAGEAAFLVAWEGDEPVGVGMLQWTGCVGERARAALPGAVEVNHLQVREEARAWHRQRADHCRRGTVQEAWPGPDGARG